MRIHGGSRLRDYCNPCTETQYNLGYALWRIPPLFMKIEVPILKKCDVLVIGGTVEACRQVEDLRRKRQCAVVLAAAMDFLGEELTGFGRIDSPPAHRLGGTPAAVKAALEEQVLSSGAQLLYRAVPVRPAYDANRHVAGWLFLGDGGYFAVAAAVVVDATRTGVAMRQLPGMRRSGGGMCEHLLRLHLLGGCAAPRSGDKAQVSLVSVEGRQLPLCCYERRVNCRIGDGNAMAREEARLRNEAWGSGTVAIAPLCEAAAVGERTAAGCSEAVEMAAGAAVRLNGQPELVTEAVLERLNRAIRQLDPVTFGERRLSSGGVEWDIAWKNHCRCERMRTLKRLPLELGAIPSGEEFAVLVAGGGTAGVKAAVSAAEKGLRALLLSRRSSLGDPGSRPEESHRLLAEALAAGVDVRFNCRMAGVALCGRRVAGVAFATPAGNCQLYRAAVVVDATGEAAVAAAAGALTAPLMPGEPVARSAALVPPDTPLEAGGGYQFVWPDDVLDFTRALVMAHDKFRRKFDVSPEVRGGEHQHIVGELMIQPQDIVMGRDYHDTIAEFHGRFDVHGASIHPLFMMAPPVERRFAARLPLRALLPQKLEAILVLGHGMSIHRDAAPVFALPEENARLGSIAGSIAARAVHSNLSLRDPQLASGIFPAAVSPAEQGGNAIPPPEAEMQLRRSAAVLLRPDQERRRLQALFEQQPTLELAKLLAFLGDSSGRDFLQHAIAQAHWENGRDPGTGAQSGTGAYCAIDTLFFALRAIGGAPQAAFARLRELTPEMALSHFRAIAMYFVRWPASAAAAEWERLLAAPGVAGHALGTIAAAPLHNRPELNDWSVRIVQLRELYTAAALFCCQPLSRESRRSLEAYRDSPQALYAEFAAAVLSRRSR